MEPSVLHDTYITLQRRPGLERIDCTKDIVRVGHPLSLRNDLSGTT